MSKSALLKTGLLLGVLMLQGAHAAGWRDVSNPLVCGKDAGSGDVFSVHGEGGISINKSDKHCAIQFYNSKTVGVKKGGFTFPSDGCFVNDVDGVTKDKVEDSGVPGVSRVLPEYVESQSDRSVHVDQDGKVKLGRSTGTAPNQSYEYGNLVDVPADGTEVEVFSRDRFFSIRVKRDGGSVVLPGGDYSKVSWATMDHRMRMIRFTSPIRAQLVEGSNCGANAGEVMGLHFARDAGNETNNINVMRLGDGCSIKVDQEPGSHTTINILGKPSVQSSSVVNFVLGKSGPCFNYSEALCRKQKQSYGELSIQGPELLSFNLYNGNWVQSDRSYVAANIYIHQGGYELTGATGTVVVGQVLAQSVSLKQSNVGTQLFAQGSGSTSLSAAPYSLSTAISDSVVTPGSSYVYRAMQRDFQDAAATKRGTSGHLRAYLMTDKGDHSQEEDGYVWDAAKRMTVELRAQKIFTEENVAATEKKGSGFKLLNEASQLDLGSGDFGSSVGDLPGTVECIINPACEDGKRLVGRAPDSLVGVPWRTQPLVVGSPDDGSILFATDDGILYSVDKVTGDLNWGWVPRDVVPYLADPIKMAQKHPWGQIFATKKSGKTFLTGTALGGQYHFSIEIGANGKTLKEVAWIDYQQGQFAPGSAAWGADGGLIGRPFGGAAPITASVSETGKVVYVVGTSADGFKLVYRSIDGTDSSRTEKVFSATAWGDTDTFSAPRISSNLWYRSDDEIYFGTAEGKVYRSDIDGKLNKIKNKSGSEISLADGGAVYWITGARLASSSGNSLMLSAQSETRMSVVEYADDAWSVAWYTGVGGSSSEGDEGTGSLSAPVPYIDSAVYKGAYLSAAPSIVNGKIILYFTNQGSDCDIQAYALGPLDLKAGASALSGVTFRKDSASLITSIGDGVSTGGWVVEIVRNGEKSVGVIATSAGDGLKTGNVGPFEMGASSTVRRLNWRELTNFF